MAARFDGEKWKRIEFLVDIELLKKFKEMKKAYNEKNTSKLLRYCIDYVYRNDRGDE